VALLILTKTVTHCEPSSYIVASVCRLTVLSTTDHVRSCDFQIVCLCWGKTSEDLTLQTYFKSVALYQLPVCTCNVWQMPIYKIWKSSAPETHINYLLLWEIIYKLNEVFITQDITPATHSYAGTCTCRHTRKCVHKCVAHTLHAS